MKLYLMRHAEAEDETPSGDDAGRHLTAAGHRRTLKAAAGLRRIVPHLGSILTSALVRAVETADLIAAAYDNQPLPQLLPALSPALPADQVLAAVASLEGQHRILLVGHEPQLSALIALLLSPRADIAIRMKKGACVALAGRSEPGAGQLCWMLTQRQLRKLA